MFRTAAAIMAFSLATLPAFAADNEPSDQGLPLSAAVAASAAAAPSVTASVDADIDWSMPPVRFGGSTTRPSALAGLYVSLAGLQAYDAYSTSRGLAAGAREANPLVRSAAGNSAMFWTLKAATTALPMMMAERMWKKNRVGAVVVMVLANSAAAAVAVNNARVVSQQR